jgi:hypothetical protein
MRAVSPLVNFVMTIFVSIMTITLVYFGIKPTVEKGFTNNMINEARANLELLASTIERVANGAEGSKSVVSLTVSDGEYFIDKNSNNIIFTFEPSVDLGVIGRIGDKFLEKGLAFFDFFNSYLDNSFPKNLINVSGNWRVFNNRLEGINGTVYYFIDKILNGFYVSSNFGSDNNLGQIFVSPANLSNLVLYLTFDEGNGNIVYDYSGNRNNGTYYGYNPHAQDNSTLLYLTGSSPINLTHYFYLPSKAILSDVNLTVSYKNNTIGGEIVKVYINGNYIGSFNSGTGSSYTFVNILKTNFTAAALNSITYEGNVTNITRSTLKYLQDIGWVDGKFGKALSFDGVDDYVIVPHNDNLNIAPGNKISILMWGYLTGWQAGYPVGVLIDKRTSGQANYNWEFDASNMRMRIHAGGGLYIVSVPHSLNRWNFYAMVLNGTWLGGYLNGELKASRIGVPASETNTVNLYLGQTIWGNYRIKGLIDEVLIYNRALSEEEIKFLYQEGLKKLQNSGMLQFNSQIKPYIAISNPSGKIYVDNLRVGNQNSKEIKLIKPFYNLEFNSSFRFSKGNHQIKIENVGFNSTSKRPIIRISES